MPEPTLDDVKVSEGTCQRRTGEIMAIQKQTLKAINGHVAFHKGAETAQAKGVTRLNSNARLFGLIFVVIMGIGGLIWTAAKLINQPDVSEIVKAVIEAQKNP